MAQITTSKLINVILLLSLSVVLIFGWMYYKQINPVEQVKLTTNGLVETIPEPKYLFSITGTGTDAFNGPRGIYVDSKTIYVTDSGHKVIRVYDYNGKLLKTIGPKIGKIELQYPRAISVINNELYVVDSGTRNIFIINPEGTSARKLQTKEKLGIPASIFSKDNKLYILESSTSPRVIIMDMQGNVLKKFGKVGIDKGQLWYPDGIYVDNQNRIIIANCQANRIDIFDENGTLVNSFDQEKAKGKINQNGEEVDVSNGYAFPNGLAVTKTGYILTGNSLGGSISFIRQDGVIVKNLKGVDEKTSMASVSGLFVDDLQRLYAVDFGLNQIFVFDLK